MITHETDVAALSALDDPVRGRLYQAVCGKAEPIGRDDAAAEAGVARALAAYHLDKLVDAGLLVASYRRPAGRGGPGAGRPAKVYARSPREFTISVPPRDYQLAAHLLAAAIAHDALAGPDAIDDVAREYGVNAGKQAAAAYGHGTKALVQALTGQGYEPVIDGDGTIRLHNCPFHELAQQHTGVVCGMNLSLIEGLTDGLGMTGPRPVLDPRPGCCCVAIHQRTSTSTGTPKPKGDTGP